MDNQKMNNNRPDQDPEGGNNKKDDMNKKSLLVMVVLAIAVMIIAQMLSGKIASASQKEVTYTEFMQDVKDGKVTADIVWSSPNYEYMLVDDVQYDPIQTEGNSEFQIPVTLDEDVAVSALTVAMSQPHLIDYTLHFDSVTLSEVTK